MDAYANLTYRRVIPTLVAVHGLDGAPGIYVVSMRKRFAGDGMAAGQQVAASNLVAKIVYCR